MTSCPVTAQHLGPNSNYSMMQKEKQQQGCLHLSDREIFCREIREGKRPSGTGVALGTINIEISMGFQAETPTLHRVALLTVGTVAAFRL